MDTRATILEIPRFLRVTLEKGVHEYETLIRHARWGEAPIYICGCGTSLPVGMAGAYLFEWLAGWPAVARSAKVFEAYTVSTVHPRSVLLVISASGEDPEALEIVRIARSRGAVPLALTRHGEGPLARACEGVFLTREEGAEDSAAAAVCQLAALSSIALIAARVLKHSSAGLELIEDELKQLPGQLEWSFTQLSDALRSLAQELRARDRFWLVGGGLYHPVVVRGARRLSAFGGIHGEGIEVSQFCSDPLPHLRRGEVAMFVSGSRLRIKRVVQQAAAQIKVKGARLISLTDSNDRELVDRSEIALVVPPLSEVGGSMLALALLELLATQVARNVERNQAGKPMPRLVDKPEHDATT
jgi:glucosamine 6-phosphate synthetase-like amidotransferase/phosphosugar isomerase protein